jgi:phosphinothricin acetyltransferase
MNEMFSFDFIEAKENDIKAMLDIYNYYIVNCTATFDWNEITLKEFKNRIFLDSNKYKTFLICINDEVIGFCFLTKFREKVAYDKTVELGLYLKPQFTGKGYGRNIVRYLEHISKLNEFETIIVSISGENMASIKLFKKMEYEQCSHYKGIAIKFGRKVDMIDFQKIL